MVLGLLEILMLLLIFDFSKKNRISNEGCQTDEQLTNNASCVHYANSPYWYDTSMGSLAVYKKLGMFEDEFSGVAVTM